MPSLLDFISAQQGQPNILGALQDEEFRNRIKQGLLDAANRGVVAGALGGPVDLATLPINAVRWLMGKAPIEKPVGGSEWLGGLMEKAGMVSPERNAPAELLAGIALPGAMVKGAAKVGPKVEQAVVRAMENAQVRPTLNPQTGAIVWHGSPHKFDKFDASKIGTGEGAQSYGHGLYFAENPGVAAVYRDELTPDPRDMINSIVDNLSGKAVGPDDIYFEMKRHPQLEDYYNSSRVKGNISTILKDTSPDGTIGADARKAYKDLDLMLPKPQGQLYKVDLPDEAIAKMLDWDKPLSEQAPEVRQAIDEIVQSEELYKGKYAPRFLDKRTTAGDAIDIFNNALGGPDVASNYLRDAGIPGIRYLDAGSRGTGQGTSNFVVFPGNEGLLTILERNGQRLEQTARPPFQYPQAEALETARKNAVTMLGLPENNTAMDRAKALGFEEGWYHGTFNDVPAFDIGRVKDRFPYSIGVHVTNRPSEASIYAQKSPADKSTIVDGANVMPLMARRGNAMNIDTKQVAASMEADLNRAQIINELVKAKNSGAPYDSVVINRSRGDEWDGANLITRDPSRLRSRFAAFDPARVNENDLLGRADLSLLGALAAGGAGAAAANEAGLLDWLKRKKEK